MNLDNYLMFALLIIGAAVVALVFLAKKSGERAKESENAVSRILMQLPSEKQMLFTMQYQNVKKNQTTAVILALLLGGLGAHKFYLGNAGVGILYLLFCWTYIPSIIAFIEAFTISMKVSQLNENNARQIASTLGHY